MRKVLILGGTTEASALAQRLAALGVPAVLSYAGRVDNPRAQPVETRVGGFGGAEGLARYLTETGITHLVDATHPFAAQMSRNAVAAVRQAGVPLLALTRPAWQPGPGDQWRIVPDMAAAVRALDGPAQRVFLALGRMHLTEFTAQPQHHYLLRLVDAPQSPPPLPSHSVIVDRGPFDMAGDLALMQAHRIDLVVAKNAGGTGAASKLEAARALRLPVILIARPDLPPRPEVHDVERVIDWLDHSGTDRGV